MERAKEVGAVVVNSPQELAALVKLNKDQEIEIKKSAEEAEANFRNHMATNGLSPEDTGIGTFADRSSFAKAFELASWGNPLFKTDGRLIGRNQIYYWSDTKKIDETNAYSYMEGDISSRDWVPTDPTIVADGYYKRTIRYIGELKQFVIVSGKKNYTVSTHIDFPTYIYSTDVIGPPVN